MEKKQIVTSRFADYVKTPQALWYWLTVTIACLAIAILLIPVNLYSWAYFRVALGLSLVLWLPGYSVTKALFPLQLRANTANGIDGIERVALSIGLSVALVPIVALILRYTPWGSDYLTAISLFALTISLSTAALVREYRNSAKHDGLENQV